MIQVVKDVDIQLFLFLNGMHHPLLDFIMYWASNRWIWIPFYAFLLWIISKKSGKTLLPLLIGIAILITFSDQLSVLVFKNHFLRYRPCHNLAIRDLVHLVVPCGGQYGFVSSHAVNCFALSAFLTTVYNQRIPILKFILFPWAILVCYSRIYNGVHFPADVLVGAVFGSVLGLLFAQLFLKLSIKYFPSKAF